MLTGPMHKKPNATRPKANTEPTATSGWPFTSSTLMTSLRPSVLTKYATAIRPAMSMPFQNALKLPATMPLRIVSDVPPSRDAVTISWTCLECELVKTFVNSGINTAASVPQLIIEASCHQSRPVTSGETPGTVRSLINSQLMPNEVVMHRSDAIQIKRVSGASKLNSVLLPYAASDHAWLMKYDTPDMKSMRNRIAKIQTMSFAC